ncbi:MAG: hypothetical protein J6V72_11150 [Kiritimatiellae bacterium]|nr:hypothetical protein [Kiritimatiellia bacterium]
MTINDTMIRDMGEAEKARKRDEEAEAYDREIRRWLFWRRFDAACNALAVVLAVGALALLAWCCVSDVPHVFNISR